MKKSEMEERIVRNLVNRAYYKGEKKPSHYIGSWFCNGRSYV